MTNQISIENLLLANMKLQLHTADASFEKKHPRDGGKFTSGGEGDSGKNDEKTQKSEERAVSAISKVDKKFSDKLETALTEKEQIDNQTDAMKGLSSGEKLLVNKFFKENPTRTPKKQLSNESRKTLEQLEDVKNLILVRLNPKRRNASLISFQGKLQTGALSDQFMSADGGQYVSYFLLNDQENLKGWGVTPDSIPRHIASFKGMPFVITAKRFFANSPYGEITDHPSTDHFKNLGIVLGGLGPMSRPREFNDLVQQAKFQEEFRVGNIEDVFQKSNGDWHALIKILPQFADMQMPNLVSPALFQINKDDPANAITSWVGMHLAGLDEQPAYGNNAIYTGSCWGTSGECLTKLSASMRDTPFIPCFKTKMASMNLKLAKIRLNLIRTFLPPMIPTELNYPYSIKLAKTTTSKKLARYQYNGHDDGESCDLFDGNVFDLSKITNRPVLPSEGLGHTNRHPNCKCTWEMIDSLTADHVEITEPTGTQLQHIHSINRKIGQKARHGTLHKVHKNGKLYKTQTDINPRIKKDFRDNSESASKMRTKKVNADADYKTGAMISDDHAVIEKENLLCTSPSGQSIACNTSNIKHEI